MTIPENMTVTALYMKIQEMQANLDKLRAIAQNYILAESIPTPWIKISPTALMSVIGITREELQSKSRRRELVEKRRMFCVLMNKYGWSKNAIAEMIVRDHTTVVHYTQSHDDWMKVDAGYRKTFQPLADKAYALISPVNAV